MVGLQERLDAIDSKLAVIESHLLDLLLPQRRAFTRHPQAEPPHIVHVDVKKLVGQVQDLNAKLDGLHEKLNATEAVPMTLEDKPFIPAEVVVEVNPVKVADLVKAEGPGA